MRQREENALQHTSRETGKVTISCYSQKHTKLIVKFSSLVM